MTHQIFTPEQFMNFLKEAQNNPGEKKDITPEYLNQCIKNSVEEMKKEQKIIENYKMAYELIPESFTHIDMLYISCQINGQDLKVFVDTGAQMTIMNLETAKRCGLEELIDYKCQGIAVGVGSQKILGKVHCVDMFIGSLALPCSFTILENGPDVMFGLNMMLSHGCKLDLKNKYLEIGEEKVAFLSGNDVPKNESFNPENV